MTRSASEQNT